MAIPRLRKWSATILKDKSLSDAAQVVSSGDTIVLYKRGGVVRTATTVTNGGTNIAIDVRDATGLAVGDVLKAWSVANLTLSTGSFTIDQITSGYAIRVDSDSNGAVTLAVGDRLVMVGPSGRVPIMYTEPSGVVSAGASLTTDSNGYAQAYVRERFVDALVSRSGSVVAFLEGELSGDDELPGFNPYNYAGNFDAGAIQDAIDDAEAGATITIPGGDWTIDTPILVNKAIHLKGDGRAGTILYMDATKNVNCIEVSAAGASVTDLKIVGPGGTGTGIGIQVGNSGGTVLSGIELSRIRIENSPSYGV